MEFVIAYTSHPAILTVHQPCSKSRSTDAQTKPSLTALLFIQTQTIVPRCPTALSPVESATHSRILCLFHSHSLFAFAESLVTVKSSSSDTIFLLAFLLARDFLQAISLVLESKDRREAKNTEDFWEQVLD